MTCNRDIVKELRIGMTIALSSRYHVKTGPPFIAIVTEIPPTLSLESSITINWMDQEKALHKSKWFKCLKTTTQSATVPLHEVILYDFELTKNGALKKHTREFKKNEY